MPFDYVAIHDGCVAGLERERDLMLLLHRVQVLHILFADGVAIFPQIGNPVATAASGGAGVDEDFEGVAVTTGLAGSFLGRGRSASHEEQQTQQERDEQGFVVHVSLL
jgi:hypothetical protein